MKIANLIEFLLYKIHKRLNKRKLFSRDAIVIYNILKNDPNKSLGKSLSDLVLLRAKYIKQDIYKLTYLLPELSFSSAIPPECFKIIRCFYYPIDYDFSKIKKVYPIHELYMRQLVCPMSQSINLLVIINALPKDFILNYTNFVFFTEKFSFLKNLQG